MRWPTVAMTLGRTISASSLRRAKLFSGACDMYERSEKNKPEHDSLPKYGSGQCEYARKARETDENKSTDRMPHPTIFPSLKITKLHTPSRSHFRNSNIRAARRNLCTSLLPETSKKRTFFFPRIHTYNIIIIINFHRSTIHLLIYSQVFILTLEPQVMYNTQYSRSSSLMY